MIACTLIAFFTQVPTASGAASSYPPLARVAVASDTYSGAEARTLLPTQHARSTATAPEHCRDGQRAIAFYSVKLKLWRSKMGAGSGARPSKGSSYPDARAASTCPHVRRLAHTLQRKAHSARLTYLNWHYYHYRWDHWLPQWAVRLAQCEEGLDWTHNDGTYEGTFAFWYGTWDGYRLPGYPSSASEATPRQQWEVARRIARKLTVGVPWGCWRGPQHAWVRGGLPEHGFRG